MSSNTYNNSLYSANSGISSTNPFVVLFMDRPPTSNDINYPIQKMWFDFSENLLFMLIGFTSFNANLQAIWFVIGPSGGGGGSFAWNEVDTPTQVLSVQNGYITNTAVTYSLPSTALLGDTVKIVGKSGSSTILTNAGQTIILGKQIATISLTSTYFSDCIELICTTPGTNSVWTADDVVGNWTNV